MENHPFIKSATAVALLMLVIPLLVWQCDRHEKIVGKYHAVDAGQDGRISATLALEANGKGLWSIETDNAPFRWEVKQNRIRLHTQSGGVVEGTIHNETIQMPIPGMGVILFKRDE